MEGNQVLRYLLIMCIAGVYSERHFPKNFPRCSRDDPKMGDCILKATETVRPLILNGVPELDIPPLEPIVIKKLNLQQGTSTLNFKASIKDLQIYGMSKYKFTKFLVDYKNLNFDCELYIPGVNLKGKYTVDGKILVVPIQGDGKFNAIVNRIDIRFYQDGKRVTKNGKTYITPIFTNTTIKVSEPKITMDGLFGNNDDLSKLATQAINSNINVLYEDLRPVLEKSVSNFFQRVMGIISSEIPEDELYPPMKSA